jgi:hypothetical protein
MMGGDFVAVVAGPLERLGAMPLWIKYLPLLALAGTIGCWLLSRRWLGAAGVLLGYVASMILLTSLATHVINDRIERVPVAHFLDEQAQQKLEQAISAKVIQQGNVLLFLRHPDRAEQIRRWLRDHEQESSEGQI